MNRTDETAAHARSFGARLREARRAHGLSQEELAHRAGLHRTYVSSIERGERNISLANIHALADGLESDVRLLFGDSNNPSEKR